MQPGEGFRTGYAPLKIGLVTVSLSCYKRVMRTFRAFLFLGVLCAAFISPDISAAESKTRVLVVTGGHDFEKPQFFQMFKDNPDITFKAVEHPNAQKLFSAEAAEDWDVLVFYDMYQPLTEEVRKNLIARLKEGKGLVVLHHAVANYQAWPEYARIIGAKHYLEKTVVDGVEKPRSLWKHDVKFKVDIADKSHPVTRGVDDFEIHDETYKLFDVAPDVQPLLKTKEPLSNEVIGWAKTYAAARVVYLQLGHDHVAYENPNYRKLLRQAIDWVAQKDAPGAS